MAENSDVEFFTHLEWNNTTEELLLSWADIAMCYTWIYDNAYRHLDRLNYRFTMPIIILSTITGTISIGINSLLPSDYVETGQKAVGAVNLITGIMTTIQNYRRYAQQVEANLTATNDWARLNRNIRIELSIEREFRRSAVDFVKSARQEYERLLNARPIIETAVLNNFRKEIKNSDIIKPEILETIEHTLLDRTRNIIELYKKPKDKKPGIIDRIKTSIDRYSSSNTPNVNSPVKHSRNDSLLTVASSPDKTHLTPISPKNNSQNLASIKEHSPIKDFSPLKIDNSSFWSRDNQIENDIQELSPDKAQLERKLTVNIDQNIFEENNDFKITIHNSEDEEKEKEN
jgi:hypothetical protein